MSFEEAVAAQTDRNAREYASRTEKVSVNVGEEEDNVLNLDLNGDVVNLDGEL